MVQTTNISKYQIIEGYKMKYKLGIIYFVFILTGCASISDKNIKKVIEEDEVATVVEEKSISEIERTGSYSYVRLLKVNDTEYAEIGKATEGEYKTEEKLEEIEKTLPIDIFP